MNLKGAGTEEEKKKLEVEVKKLKDELASTKKGEEVGTELFPWKY